MDITAGGFAFMSLEFMVMPIRQYNQGKIRSEHSDGASELFAAAIASQARAWQGTVCDGGLLGR